MRLEKGGKFKELNFWVITARFGLHPPTPTPPRYSAAIIAATRLVSSPFLRVYAPEPLGSRCFCEQGVGGEALEAK